VPLPRVVTHTAGAVMVALSGGLFVAAFYPGWDPSVVWNGAIPDVGLSRLALATSSLVGVGLGFHLMTLGGAAAPVRRAAAPRTAQVVEAELFVDEEPSAPSAPAPAPAPLTRKEAALASLDAEIKVITRKIGKARVMLATGQLSKEGYVHYVKGLELKRAELEKSRVRTEIGPGAVRPAPPRDLSH